ncbi:MAG: alkaline phosphatase family protein [Bryobacteraceae bacterium]|nr:alkaline phosphatase family protein [Bryobacteraceae bacterium]
MRIKLPLAGALLASAALAAQHVVIVTVDGLAAYHLLNQQLLMPNIRDLIDNGVWAESSQTVFPSVTHPSHTTILTGVEPRLHGVLGNGMVNRNTGERFHPTNRPRKDIVMVPTLFDAAKAKGLRTAAFYWPETKDDPSIDFNIPEVFNDANAADIRAVPPEVLRELRDAGVPIDNFFRWYGGPRAGAGDLILADAAAHAIRAHKPNLIAIHLVSTDGAQHGYGPHHYLSQSAITLADECIGTIRRALDVAGIASDAAIVVTADHGFHSVYENANVWPAFASAGLAGKVKLHGAGWSVAVELAAAFRPADQPALDAAFTQLKQAGLVVRVAGPDDMHALGQPRYEESDYAAGHYLLIPGIDLHLVVEPDNPSMKRRPKPVPYHGHGYLPHHPRMFPALVLSGAGIRRGAIVGHVRNLDIAPTVAHLLDLELGPTSGRVLREALTDK